MEQWSWRNRMACGSSRERTRAYSTRSIKAPFNRQANYSDSWVLTTSCWMARSMPLLEHIERPVDAGWLVEFGGSMSAAGILGALAAPPSWMTPRMHVCLHWNPIMHMATYFSREFFTELGGFNIDYKDAGDFEMFARALSKEPYERVDKQISCFRRTGQNNSIVNTKRAALEAQSVCEAFGPKANAERLFWRIVLRGWFNIANPEWLIRKHADMVRVRLRLQEKAYF